MSLIASAALALSFDAASLMDALRASLPAELVPRLAWCAAGAAAAGLVLLLFGVSLARLLATAALAAVGAAIGVLVGRAYAGSVNFAYLPAAAALGGAVLAGLLGLVLHRFWIILATGALFATIATSVCLAMVAGPELADLLDQWAGQGASQPAAASPAPADLLPPGGIELSPGPPPAPAAKRTEAWGQLLDTLGGHGLSCGISALGGFVFGLLLGAYGFRLAAVLLTSLVGVALISAGLMLLAALHRPDLFDRVVQLHYKSLMPVAGLLLIGLSLQAAQARHQRRARAARIAQADAGADKSDGD